MPAGGVKSVSWPWLSPFQRWGSLTRAYTGKFVDMAHYFLLLQSIPLPFGLIEDDDGLSALCHGDGFACHQRVLKMFPGPGYLISDDWIV